MNTKKFYKKEIYEGFQVSPGMISDQGKELKTLIPGVVLTEILSSDRIVLHTRSTRLIITAGTWILKDKNGKHLAVSQEQLEKDFEIIKQQS